MKSWVVAELFARPHILADPFDRRLVDHMPQFEERRVRLRFGLLGVPPVDEQRRLGLQNDRDSGRTREPRQPQEALGVRGYVLVLMLVRPWNDKSRYPRGFERPSQFGD